MIYVIDTHAIIWYIDNDPPLSRQAGTVLDDPASELVVPTIALAEMRHLYDKRRIKTDPATIQQKIIDARNCEIYPLDEKVVSQIPTGLNIHDSIIVATALVCRDIYQQPVTLITKDREIRQSGLVPTLW